MARSSPPTSAGIAITVLSIFQLVAGQPEIPYSSSRTALDQWIQNTRADLTFVGAARDSPGNPFDVRLIYCSERRGPRNDRCGGSCVVYTGQGGQCLKTNFDTECLAATQNVVFCASDTCDRPCNSYSKCGGRMDSGFCFTPGTKSIRVSTNAGDVPDDEGEPRAPIQSSISVPASSADLPPASTSSPQGLSQTDTSSPSTAPSVPSSSSPPSPPSSRSPSMVYSYVSNTLLPFSTGPPVAASTGTDLPGVEAAGANQANNASLSPGAIAGIILGVLFMLGATLCAILWLRYKTRRLSMLTAHKPTPWLPPPQPPMASPPSSSPFTPPGPSMLPYYRDGADDRDYDSIYAASSAGRRISYDGPASVSGLSYATNPSAMLAPAPVPAHGNPFGSSGAVMQQRAYGEVDGDDDDKASSRFGDYLVRPSPNSANGMVPHRVDSAEIRSHYNQY